MPEQEGLALLMQIEKSRKVSAIFWVLSVICMAVIFYFSSRTADESSAQSSNVVGWLTSLFGDNIFTTFIVRKGAHFLEYTGLCLLLNWAWIFTRGKASPFLSVGLSSLYAVTDELHQLFVEGRSCELRDWAIDTVGAILGAVAFYVTLLIVRLILKRIDISKNKL